MQIRRAINKLIKKLNISYARYLRLKRSDRFLSVDELSSAERHSKRVAFLKKFSKRMVIILILLIIIWPLINKDWSGKKLSFQNDSKQSQKTEVKKEGELPVMLKPNFLGNDNSGKPFNITADSGVGVTENKIILTNINADMLLKDDSKVHLVSTHGDYANGDKKLILHDGVVIDTAKGYEFKTNSAFVNLNDNTATGSEKVKITGRLGDIDANGFEIRNDGEETILFGGINLNAVIEQKPTNGAKN